MTEKSVALPEDGKEPGMGNTMARRIEYSLVILCLLALAAIFQPFSKAVYGIGAGLIIFAGLAFNLMPFCNPETPLRKVYRTAIIVTVVFIVVTLFAIGSAELYGVYLRSAQ